MIDKDVELTSNAADCFFFILWLSAPSPPIAHNQARIPICRPILVTLSSATIALVASSTTTRHERNIRHTPAAATPTVAPHSLSRRPASWASWRKCRPQWERISREEESSLVVCLGPAIHCSRLGRKYPRFAHHLAGKWTSTLRLDEPWAESCLHFGCCR